MRGAYPEPRATLRVKGRSSVAKEQSFDDGAMERPERRGLLQPAAQGWHIYNEALTAGAASLVLCSAGIILGFVESMVLGKHNCVGEKGQVALWTCLLWVSCLLSRALDIVLRLGNPRTNSIVIFLSSGFLGAALPHIIPKVTQQIDSPEVWMPTCASVLPSESICAVTESVPLIRTGITKILLGAGLQGCMTDAKATLQGAWHNESAEEREGARAWPRGKDRNVEDERNGAKDRDPDRNGAKEHKSIATEKLTALVAAEEERSTRTPASSAPGNLELSTAAEVIPSMPQVQVDPAWADQAAIWSDPQQAWAVPIGGEAGIALYAGIPVMPPALLPSLRSLHLQRARQDGRPTRSGIQTKTERTLERRQIGVFC